jgi:hypothetical protein
MTDELSERRDALVRTLAHRFDDRVPDYCEMNDQELLAEVARVRAAGQIAMWELVDELAARLERTPPPAAGKGIVIVGEPGEI